MKHAAVIVLLCLGILFFTSLNKTSATVVYEPTQDTTKEKAYTILEQKCNPCHTKKKPAYVFTKENMNFFTFVIQEQVFIKKKMPKGKANKLTETEYDYLKKWIDQRVNH